MGAAKPNSVDESLGIIVSMIQSTQEKINNNSFFFLLWGWTLVCIYVGIYIMHSFTDYGQYANSLWIITMPLGIFTGLYSRKMRGSNSNQVKEYFYNLYGKVWGGFLVPLAITIVLGIIIGSTHIDAMIMLLAGFAVYTPGLILRYTPIIVGAFFLWAGAALCLYLEGPETQLVAAAAYALGYIVPAYMMKASKKTA